MVFKLFELRHDVILLLFLEFIDGIFMNGAHGVSQDNFMDYNEENGKLGEYLNMAEFPFSS